MDIAKDTKSVYIWNMLASIAYSFQSVFILIVLARTCDIVAAGIFSIAWTSGNLLLNIGKYGIRNFQVSDVRNAYDFSDYLGARTVTSAVMIAVLLAYVAISSALFGYSAEKTYIILVVCLLKDMDAIEDVYHGHYQKNDNLKIASKMLFARITATTVLMCIVAAATSSLLISSIAGVAFSAAFIVFSVIFVGHRYSFPVWQKIAKSNVVKIAALLKTTFPLFISSFLIFYICNAPRYGIDACMSDVEQAYYGYIAMPAFIIGLFATFVYNPIILKMSEDWDAGNVKAFVVEFSKQSAIIAGLTVAFMGVMFTIGIPILNVLYATTLDAFVIESVILMAAGGFMALSTLVSIGITILRRQSVMLPIYAVVTVVSFAINEPMVNNMGIMGASLEYLALMAMLAVLLSGYFAFRVWRDGKTSC